MNHLFAAKYGLMKAAGQHADVCLLLTQDGWVTFGRDAQLVCIAQRLEPVSEVTVIPTFVSHLIPRLTEAGHSVALLDYWSPNLTVKPQPTLIVRLERKVTEDWI